MSIVVCYQGKKKTFKLSSNLSPLSTLYQLISTSFEIDSNSFVLHYRGKMLDKTTPFSMLGISNNVEIDIVLQSKVFTIYIYKYTNASILY
jgi:hypothetical protein